MVFETTAYADSAIKPTSLLDHTKADLDARLLASFGKLAHPKESPLCQFNCNSDEIREEDNPMFTALVGSLIVLGQTAHGALPARSPELQFPVGHIYFYGYAGLDPDRVKAHLPIHLGQMVDLNGFDHEKDLIQKAVLAETGRPATDVAAVCCDQDHHLLLYIGLSGTSSRKLPLRKPPSGTDHLDHEGMQLYEKDSAALEKAVESGDASEDDSKGYALQHNPAAHKIQMDMRTYALDRGSELETVLRDSANPEEREASACLLGYAGRSRAQIRALIAASMDPDSDVRNNAVRALSVLFSTKDQIPANLNIRPLVSLLWSGQWTDRNKASGALAAISRDHNPSLLQQLRETAMPPLLEGARWDAGHSGFFLLILGRIAGIPSSQLQKEIAAGDSSSIINAADGAK